MVDDQFAWQLAQILATPARQTTRWCGAPAAERGIRRRRFVDQFDAMLAPLRTILAGRN